MLTGEVFKLNYPFLSKKDSINIQLSKKKLCEKYDLKSNDVFYLYTGRISLQKNIHHLIDLIKERPANHKLLICGEFDDITNNEKSLSYFPGFYYSMLTKKINDLYVENKVIFYGSLSSECLKDFYIASDVFISLSTYNLEDYGVAPLEAYSYGCNLTLSDWGGFSNLKTLKNVQLLESQMNLDNIYINLDKKDSLASKKKCLSKIENQRREVKALFNDNFCYELERILLKEGKNLTIGPTKKQWRCNQYREKKEYLSHFSNMCSNIKDASNFVRIEDFLEEAIQTTIMPYSITIDENINSDIKFNLYNYYGNTMPLFTQALLENRKSIKNPIFLRDIDLEEDTLMKLLERYRENTFLVLDNGPLSNLFKDRVLPVSIVQRRIEKKNKLIVNMIQRKKVLDINKLRGLIKDYREVYFIDYKTSFFYKNGTKYELEALKPIVDRGINTNVSLLSELMKDFDLGEYNYLSLVDKKLIGDSYIDYKFLALGLGEVSLPQVDEIDYPLSPYHGLNIIKSSS